MTDENKQKILQSCETLSFLFAEMAEFGMNLEGAVGLNPYTNSAVESIGIRLNKATEIIKLIPKYLEDK